MDEILIKDFLQQLVEVHGETSMSMKMHSLSHLVANCFDHGPVYKNSSYEFENSIRLFKNLCHNHIIPAKQIFHRTMEIWELKKQKNALAKHQLEFKIFDKHLRRAEIKKVRFRGTYYGVARKDAFFAHHDGKELRYYMITEIRASGQSAKHITFKTRKLNRLKTYVEPLKSELLGIFLWKNGTFEEGIFQLKISDFKFKLCVLPVDTVGMEAFVTLPMSEIVWNSEF